MVNSILWHSDHHISPIDDHGLPRHKITLIGTEKDQGSKQILRNLDPLKASSCDALPFEFNRFGIILRDTEGRAWSQSVHSDSESPSSRANVLVKPRTPALEVT